MSAASEEHNLLIISDLHLSEGQDRTTGRFSPREDFFFDHEFARFLAYHARQAAHNPSHGGRPWRLVLNGDAFDLLQVVAKPRPVISDFEKDEGGWELMRDLAAGQRSYASNGCLCLETTFGGEELQEAGVAHYFPDPADLSSFARLRARVRPTETAQSLSATFRLMLGSEKTASEPQWTPLKPGQWSEITYDLSAAGKPALEQVCRVQLRVSSSVAQSTSLCIDEVWVEPLLTPREERYGLGTSPEQAAWKLQYSARGHPEFFQALARFLSQGHRMVHIKGNHDVDIHWPLVQETFRDQVVEAARQCPDLEVVDVADLRSRIEFAPWVHYEPGLAYVEHGNQYEPSNFFRDFLNPVMPEDPDHLELPLGSFLVRYMFNSLEAKHPWADNLKPATEYIKWLLTRDPFGAIATFVDNLGLIARAAWQAFRKRAIVPRVDRSVWQDREARGLLLEGLPPDAMWEIAEVSHARVADWWRRILRSASLGGLSFILLVGVSVLFLRPLLDLIRPGPTETPWLALAAQLGGSVLLYVLRQFIARRFRHLSEGDYLEQVAEEIAPILERHGLSVPYLVFGHTHNAHISQLPRQPEVDFQQWYVNTGTWTQVWSEEQRLVRDSKQFTFFPILRGQEAARPTLWHWNDDGGRPAPVLLFKE